MSSGSQVTGRGLGACDLREMGQVCGGMETYQETEKPKLNSGTPTEKAECNSKGDPYGDGSMQFQGRSLWRLLNARLNAIARRTPVPSSGHLFPVPGSHRSLFLIIFYWPRSEIRDPCGDCACLGSGCYSHRANSNLTHHRKAEQQRPCPCLRRRLALRVCPSCPSLTIQPSAPRWENWRCPFIGHHHRWLFRALNNSLYRLSQAYDSGPLWVAFYGVYLLFKESHQFITEMGSQRKASAV